MNTTAYEKSAGQFGPLSPPWMLDAAVEVQEVCRCWFGHRGGKAMPSLADLDLADMAERFPGLLLARIVNEGNASRFLFYPARMAAAIGSDTARGLDPDLFRHIPLAGCRTAALKRAPLADRVSLLSSDGLAVDSEVIYLPLAPDGGQVDCVLILTVETLPDDFATPCFRDRPPAL